MSDVVWKGQTGFLFCESEVSRDRVTLIHCNLFRVLLNYQQRLLKLCLVEVDSDRPNNKTVSVSPNYGTRLVPCRVILINKSAYAAPGPLFDSGSAATCLNEPHEGLVASGEGGTTGPCHPWRLDRC